MAVTQWGAWSFDRRDDEIADLSWHGALVLRSIRAVVRDRNWATGDLRITGISEASGALSLAVSCTDLGADIHGTVSVTADGDAVTVSMDVESRSTFLSNRIGLVVLHPQRLAGDPLRVLHTDDSRETAAFPLAVSPHQPVFDIRALEWSADDLTIAVAFEGDTFEMEDQRNWSDASYKTYSRPLDLPFPYEISAGEQIVQRVTVAVAGAAPSVAGDEDVIQLEPRGRFPRILLGASTAPEPAPPFAPLGDGVLVELDLASTNWRAALERAAAAGLPLDVRLTVPPAEDALWGTKIPGGITENALTEIMTDAVATLAPHDVLRIAAFDPITHVTEPQATAALRYALAGREISILEGARSHFTELNREQERVITDGDGVTFATTPLFHTLGEEQLFESIAVQRTLAEQALTIADGRPVHIGPVTLVPRFNNVATVPPAAPSRADVAEGYGTQFTGSSDPRQSSEALATWTIASAAALAMPGVETLTYFEQWGERGVASALGEPSAVEAALRTLATFSGAEFHSGSSSDGRLWIFRASTGIATILVAANLDTDVRNATITTRGEEDLHLTIAPREYQTLTLLR